MTGAQDLRALFKSLLLRLQDSKDLRDLLLGELTKKDTFLKDTVFHDVTL